MQETTIVITKDGAVASKKKKPPPNRGVKNGEMGAPKKVVPMELVAVACDYNATAKQVLASLRSQGYDISLNTLEREIRRLYDCTFGEYRDKRVDQTRLRLVQKAVQMALDGNVTMLIFCLKNLCGWKDKTEEQLNLNQPIPVAYVPRSQRGAAS